jgi:hypothetical protein
MRKLLLLLLIFSLVPLLAGCSKKTKFSGMIIELVRYQYDNNEESFFIITNGEIIELEEIGKGVCLVNCEWEYILKNYSDISEIPEIKYYEYQSIIYYAYLNDELIDTNYDESITEFTTANFTSKNTLFKSEVVTRSISLFGFEANKYGNYRIVLEANLIIDGVENKSSIEFNFTLKSK